MTIVLMFFMIMGAVSAAESIDVSDTEDSNLIGDNDDSLSTNNKLEISSEDSISETNIVNSHDDNLGNYPDEEVLNASADSYYEDNQVITSNGDEVDTDVLSSTGSSSGNEKVAGTEKETTKNKRTGRAWGNIGVTTSQQMLQSEFELATWNIVQNITNTFLHEFCIMVY